MNLAAVPGITVGHATIDDHGTGCTVILAPETGLRAAACVRGRATGTRELEERSVAIEEVALDALAAARDWEGTEAALTKLAEELGAPREELALELKRRRAGA